MRPATRDRPAQGPRYRLAQFCRAIGARPNAAGLAEVRRQLSPAQQALFFSMSPRDQWHSIETLRLLPLALRGDADLALAALLHDTGKGYIRLHERVLYVLLALAPPLLRRVSAPCNGPRGALYRTLNHAQSGADLARAAGASPRAAALIRAHHLPDPDDAAALALLDADDRA